MRAAVLEDWQKIVVNEVDEPDMQDGEVLLRVRSAALCGSDIHIFNGDNPIAVTPVIQGHEFMGEVVKIAGRASAGYSVGSRVVVQPLISCGSCTACLTGNPTCMQISNCYWCKPKRWFWRVCLCARRHFV